ncbi:hypothetical protein FRC07_004859 [Ceratobasidium sp. 392]|nr:hypothetical protein FRC07_004859 [Ceratobasidium sp. 392]
MSTDNEHARRVKFPKFRAAYEKRIAKERRDAGLDDEVEEERPPVVDFASRLTADRTALTRSPDQVSLSSLSSSPSVDDAPPPRTSGGGGGLFFHQHYRHRRARSQDSQGPEPEPKPHRYQHDDEFVMQRQRSRSKYETSSNGSSEQRVPIRVKTQPQPNKPHGGIQPPAYVREHNLPITIPDHLLPFLSPITPSTAAPPDPQEELERYGREPTSEYLQSLPIRALSTPIRTTFMLQPEDSPPPPAQPQQLMSIPEQPTPAESTVPSSPSTSIMSRPYEPSPSPPPRLAFDDHGRVLKLGSLGWERETGPMYDDLPTLPPLGVSSTSSPLEPTPVRAIAPAPLPAPIRAPAPAPAPVRAPARPPSAPRPLPVPTDSDSDSDDAPDRDASDSEPDQPSPKQEKSVVSGSVGTVQVKRYTLNRPEEREPVREGLASRSFSGSTGRGGKASVPGRSSTLGGRAGGSVDFTPGRSSTLGPAAGLGRSSLGLTTRPTAVSRNSTGEWAVLGSGSGSGGSGGGQRFDEFGARVPSGPSFGGSRQAASLGARPGGGQPPEKNTSATGTSSEKTTPSKQSHVSRASMSSPAPAGRQSPAGPSTRQFASPTPSRPFSPTLAWNGLTPASPRQSISSTSRSPSLSSTAGEIVGEPKPFDEEAFLNDIKFGITRAIMADASGSGSRRGTPPQSAPLSARTPPPETRTPPPTTRTPPPNVARAPPLPPLATRPSPAVTRTPTPPGARPLPTPPTTRPLPSPPAASRPLPSPPAAARPPLPTPPTRAPLPTPPARAPLPPFPAMRPPHMSSPLARVSAGPSPRVSDAPSARSSTVPSVRDSNTPSARNSPVRSSTVSSARISTTPPARPASPTASEYSAVGRTRRRARPMGTSVVGGGEAESVVGGGDEESVIDGWDDGESAIGGGESVVGETVGGGRAESVVGGSRRTSVVESAKAASVVGGSRRTSVDPEHGPSSIEVDAVINRMAGMNIGAIPEATELPMTIERVDSDSGITSPVVPPGAPSDAGSLFSRVVSPKPTPAKLRLGAVRMSTTSTPTKSTTAAQGTPPRAVRSRPRPDSALSAAARVPAPASVGSTKPPAPEVRPESVFSSGANLRRSADPAQMPMPRTRSVFSRGPESVTSAVSEASKEPVGLFGRLQAAVSKPVQRGSTASKVPGLLGSSNAPKQTPKQTKTGKGKTPASASDDFDGGLTSSEEEDGDEEDEDSDTKTTVADDDGLDHLTESIEGASGFQPESPVVERPTGREHANSRPREHAGPAPPSEPIDQPLSVSPQLMPSADPALLEPLEGETMPDEVLSLNPVICDACYAPMPLAKWTEHIAKSGHRRNAARYSQLLMEQSTHGQPTPINDARERWAEVTRIQPRRAHPSEYAFCDVCAVFLLRGDLEHFQGKKHHRCVRAAALNDADELESVRGSVSDEENGPSAWAFRGAAAPSGALGQQAFHRPGAAEQVTWNGA